MDAAEKSERLVEVAMAVLQGAGGELGITVLNKALFYLDLRHLRDAGALATGATYLALKNGPVVAKYEKKLVRELVQRGFVVQDDGEPYGRPLRVVRSMKSFNLDGLALSSADTVSKWAKDKLAKEASDISHGNIGWQMAWAEAQSTGAGAYPIDMNIAMQQIADRDPWLDEPLTEREQSRVDAVARGEVVAW